MGLIKTNLAKHPATEGNIKAIARHFSEGASKAQTLGLELEHIIVRRGDGAAVPYAGDRGVERLLESLAAQYDFIQHVHDDGTGGLLGMAREGHAITLEPAAQVEISISPHASIDAIGREYEGFRSALDPALDAIDAKAAEVSYHPTAHAAELELIPKFRYACMSEHFAGIGPWGVRMMRATASTQVSIDYTCESDAIAKLRVASALGPLFYLMLDNAPVFEGLKRPRRTIREACWTGCDPDRCMVVPGLFEDGFGFESYAAWLLSVPAILISSADAPGGWRKTGPLSFNDIYAQDLMTETEIDHALSMLFPDVRLKNYIEIRQADAVPCELALAYAALIKGIFYSERNLSALSEWCAGFDDGTVPAMKADVAELGWDAEARRADGSPATMGDLADSLLEMASLALSDVEKGALEPLSKLIEQRKTPAEIR